MDGALVGARPEAASADIDIAESEAGLRLLVRLRRGEAELGVKTLTVPSCDEALDAAVLIVAVAVGEASAVPDPADTEVAVVAREPWRPRLPARRMADDTSPAESASEASSSPSASTLLLGGADLGTLPRATPYVGAAVALHWLPVELRAAFRFGMRREELAEESGASERTSAGFAAVELSGCRGTGSKLRWALCAGGELGLVQLEHSRSAAADSVDTDESTPRLAGVLAGRAGSQLGGLLVELELGGFATAIGPVSGSRVGARAGVGAGLQF